MIYDILYPWQKKIVDSLSDKRAYGLFLDMGLGKTPLSLALCERHKCDRVLVVTLKSKAVESEFVDGSWKFWLTKYTPSPSSLVINYEALYDHKAARDNKLEFSPVVKEFLATCTAKRCAIILDESHRIKSSSTAQTKILKKIKAALQLKTPTLYTYLLSGTPFSSGYIDLYNQLSFLGCPMTKTAFKEQFCKIGRIKGLLEWQQPIVGYKNIPQLFRLVHQYALTIESEQVVDLPQKLFVSHFVEPGVFFHTFTHQILTRAKFEALCAKRDALNLPALPEEERLHPQTPRENSSLVINPWFRNVNYPDMSCVADTPASLWMRARQLSIGFQGSDTTSTWYDLSRFDEIEKFLASHRDNYVLFYTYQAEFFVLYSILENLGYNIDVYNGLVKSLYWYDKFSNQPPEEQVVNRGNVILTNFASGSTGMNWQLYTKCIMSSLPLYKDWAQGIKRIHRIGSKVPVTYHIFRGKNWLDDEMWEALENKTDYNEKMFDKKLNEVKLEVDK